MINASQPTINDNQKYVFLFKVSKPFLPKYTFSTKLTLSYYLSELKVKNPDNSYSF